MNNACGRNVSKEHECRPRFDRYVTPQWVINVLLNKYTPPPGIIVDPCAGGHSSVKPIGFQLAQRHGRRSLLFDLEPGPDHPGIVQADWLETHAPKVSGGIVETSNTPFGDLLEEFVLKGLREAKEIAFLVPYLWLMASGTSPSKARRRRGDVGVLNRTDGLRLIIQPQRRVCFELTPDDAQTRIEWNQNRPPGTKPVAVKKSRESSTGWTVGSPGGAHVWAVWRPEWPREVGARIIFVPDVECRQAEASC